MSTERSSRGLASIMFDELDSLQAGDSTPQMARSKAAIANTICAISRLEMDFSRFVSNNKADTSNPAALSEIPMGKLEG